jgi:hypothetical protein
MTYDLSRITELWQSQWTGVLFLDEAESPTGKPYVLYGNPADARLYKAIKRLVRQWPEREDWEAAAVVYTKPEAI